MKNLPFSTALLLGLMMLGGCAHHTPPEEVARNFWTAVVENDLETASELTARDTLKEPNLLSNKDKTLKSVEIGAATASESTAEVATTLIGENENAETRLPITTFLVKEDEQWKVDGQQSVNALVASSVNMMMSDMTNSLSSIGQDLSNSITGGLQEFMSAFSKELPTMRKELERLSDEEKTKDFGKQLGTLFSEGLRDAMKELNSSLETLGKELEKSTSPASTDPATTEHKI